MIIKNDLHIHSHCSCDSACASMQDIFNDAEAAGIQHIGVADHLHTAFNMPDIEISRKEFIEFGNRPNFHFGLEASCATAWECEKIAKRDFSSCFTYDLKGKPFQTMTPIDGIMYGGPAGGPLTVDITKEDIERLGIEYVIGGVHKPNYTEQEPESIIDDFFNQTCFLIKHELIDIIAHVWDGLAFWSSYYIVTHDPADYNIEVFYQIPDEYWDEIAHLLIQHNKLVEINGCGIPMDSKVFRYYMENLAKWRDKGIKFTYGSDQHSSHYKTGKLKKYNALLQEYGFSANDFALPPRLK